MTAPARPGRARGPEDAAIGSDVPPLFSSGPLREFCPTAGVSADILTIGPIASSNTEVLTTVARTADQTRDQELAEDELIEAGPLRPGKAARAVVSDGRAVRDAIEAVLASPGAASV